MRVSGIFKRFISLFTCLLMIMSTVGDISGLFMPSISPLRRPSAGYLNGLTQTMSTAGQSRTVVLSNVEREADPSTMDTYKTMLDFSENTRYVGRLWSDKTVFAHGYADKGDSDWNEVTNTLTLDKDDDGLDGEVALDSGFLHVFSAMGSSQTFKGVPPTRTVIVFDNSGSMYSSNSTGSWAEQRIAKTVKAINAAIDSLMNASKYNQVAVVLFGDGENTDMESYTVAELNKSGSDTNLGVTTTAFHGNNTAVTVIPMGHYTPDKNATSEKPTEYLKAGWGTNATMDGSNPNHDSKNRGEKGWVFVNHNFVPKDGATSNSYTSYRNGTTNINAGIYQGMKELLNASKTETVGTYTFNCIPALVVLTDGESTDAISQWQYDDKFNMKSLGFINDFSDKSDTFIGYDTDTPKGGCSWDQFVEEYTGTEGLYEWQTIGGTGNSDGPTTPEGKAAVQALSDDYATDKAYMILNTVLTAAYCKTAATKEYKNDCKIYTISVDMPNPAGSYPSDPDKFTTNGPTMNPNQFFNEDWIREISMFTKPMPERAGEEGTEETSVYKEGTVAYQTRKGIITALKWLGQLENGESITNLRYRSILGGSESFYGGDKNKIKDVNSGGANHSSFWRCTLVKKDASIEVIDENKDPYGLTTKDVLANVNYVQGAYYPTTAAAASDDIQEAFDNIVKELNEPLYSPVAGGNDLGVDDSVTYVDPIGKYMEVKDVKGLSLFGNYYGIVETAEYNWQFNDDYIRGHNGTAGVDTFEAGWYKGDDGETAQKWGGTGDTPGGSSAAAWAEGWVYRLNSDLAVQFVPSLEAIKTSDPDDKIKNTTYRFFRLDTEKDSSGVAKKLESGDRDEVKMNPAYGTTFPNSYKEEKYQETPGAYKLSDLRIWVEDSGDYSDSAIEDSGSKTDANFDEALYINIPVNMLPLRTVTIDLSQAESKYTTNQGSVASYPLRVFYTVGIEDDYIKESNGEYTIDLTGVSLEYLNENRANTQAAADARGIELGSVEFFSNWYNPAARYSDYATTQADYTFGDPMISFSPSTDNRYYIFEKALPIYDTAYVYTKGQWRRVAINEESSTADSRTFLPADFGGKLIAQDLEDVEISNDPAANTEAINAKLNGKEAAEGDIVLLKSDRLDDVTKPEKEGDKDPFSSDAYYYFAIEYYTKSETGGADPVQYVITRKGSEFGSAYHTSGINNGDMLVWHDLSGKYPDYPYLSYSETNNASRGKDFIGVELDEKTGYYKGLEKSEHEIPGEDYAQKPGYEAERKNGQWVVATKPGGLRVGALAQAVQLKGTTYTKYDPNYIKDRFPDSPADTSWVYYNNNITRTSNSYYLPTISSSSQAGEDDIIVNVYLGNNGRLEVQDTELLLTKLVECPLSGAEPDPDKEFDFQVYINGFTQDEQAIVVRYNPETQNWQRQLHYIDLELSANLFLQTSDGNLVLVDKNGKRVIRSYGAEYDEESSTYKYKYTYADGGAEYKADDGGPYYVYIGTNTNSDPDIKAPITGLRVFHNDAVDSKGSVDLEDVKVEFYKKAGEGEDHDTKLDNSEFTDWNAISGVDYVKFLRKVYLFSQDEYNEYVSGTGALTSETIDNFELVKVSFDSQSDMITIDSDYRTSSAYWRETVPFGVRPATDEEIAAQKADENGRIKLEKADLCFPDNVNAEPANTAVVKLRSGWGLIFSSLQHGTNYALVEHLGDDDLEQGYSFDRIEHVQQSSSETKTATDFANAEKPHEHDYYVIGDTAGEGETKIEEGHFFNVWNLLKDETKVNEEDAEKNEETGLYPPVNVGDEITYTIKWANHTDEDGVVTITDCLDMGVDFVEAGMVPGNSENPQYVYGGGKATAASPSFSGTTDDGKYAYSIEYDPDSHSVTWIIGSESATSGVNGKVAKGDFGTVTLTVRVNDKAEKTWNYGSDSGTGAPGSGEDNLVHNRATVAVGDNSYTTNIVTNPCGTPDKNEIGIEHNGENETITNGDGVYDPDENLWEGPAVHVGDIIEYEITFDNNIAEPAVITITDPLDENVSFVSAELGGIKLEAGQTHASGEISLTYTKEDGTPANVNNVPADIWLRERDGVTYVIWGIGSVTEQMPSYDKEFNASHAIPVPPTATGSATLKVKVEEGALVPHQVDNYADVQVGNSRTVRTKTVENKIPEPEKTEVTPGDGNQVGVGEEITYKITWQNQNAKPAVVTITDPLDIGVDFVEAAVGDALLSDSSTECTGNVTIGDVSVPVTIKYINHTVTWTFGEGGGVPGNASGEVTLKVRVNEKAVTTWTYNKGNSGTEGAGKDYEVVNRASVTVGNDTQFTDIVENPVPEKTEVKPGEDKPVKVGDSVTYNIHWKNGYDRPAKVVVTDPLDKGVYFESASYGDVKIDASNTTAAGSVMFDDVSVPVEIKFENGTVTWTIGDDNAKVPAGASGDVSLTVKVNKDAVKTWSYKESAGTEGDNTNDYRIVNRARVEVDNQGAYTAEVENPVPEKTEVNPGEDKPVKVGDVVTYNIGWKNTKDNGTAITVTDKLDPGVDFVSAGMLEGPDDELYVYSSEGITADSRTYTGVTSEGYAYSITYSPSTHTVIWTIGKNGNGVEVGSQQFSGEYVTSLPAGAYGVLALTVKVNENAVKTWSYDEASEGGEDNKIVNRAEIKVGNDSVTTAEVENPVSEKTETIPGDDVQVQVGEDISYEISWSNTEDKDATVTVTDPLDIGVDFVSASYGGVTLDKTGTVDDDATVGKQHVKITYDKGSHTVTWTITGAAPGESGKVSLNVKVNENAFKAWDYDTEGSTDEDYDYKVVNRAHVQINDNGGYTTEVENPVPEKTEVEPGEDMPVKVGDRITYNIGWANTADKPALIVITDELDKGVDFVSANNGGVYNAEIHTVTWTFNADEHESGAVELVVMVNHNATPVGEVKNQAAVEVDHVSKVTSEVKNTTPDGGFSVTKTVDPNGLGDYDKDVKFDFTVKFTSPDGQKLTLDYSENENIYKLVEDNGAAVEDDTTVEFKLEDGETVKFEGLPVGTTYTVTETSNGKYETTLSVDGDEEGKIEASSYTSQIVEDGENSVKINYTNKRRSAQITVKKTVEHGLPSDYKKTFEFTVNILYNGKIIRESHFNLSDSHRTVLKGIPTGARISISEVLPSEFIDEEYTFIVDGVEQKPNTWFTIGDSVTEITINCVNTRKTGELKVEKAVFGDGEIPDDDFNFTLKLSDEASAENATVLDSIIGDKYTIGDKEPVSGKYIIEDDGLFHFTLKHDQYIIFKEIPIGAKYTVTEERDGKYLVYMGTSEEDVTLNDSAQASGKITEGTNSEHFFNRPKHMPEKTEVTPGDGMSVGVGNEITYNITWYNDRPDKATVTVRDPLDTGVDFVSADNGGVYNAETHTVTWTISAEPESKGTVTLVVKVNKNALDSAYTVDNTAYVKVNNDSEQETETVSNPTAEVKIHKEQSAVDKKGNTVHEKTTEEFIVEDGDIVTYYLTVTATGEKGAVVKNVWVRDKVPEGLEFKKADNGEKLDEDGYVYWSLGDMKPGESKQVSFDVKVPYRDEATVWTNVAEVTSNTDKPEDPDNPWEPSNEVKIKEYVGGISVTKVLEAAVGAELTGADNDIDFTFTLTLTPPEGSYLDNVMFEITKDGKTVADASAVTNEGNVYTFKLKADETLNVSGIPYGTHYALTETPTAGYESPKAIEKSTGTITGEAAIAVTVTNTKPATTPVSLPIVGEKVFKYAGTDDDVGLEEGQFSFKITESEGAPKPEHSEAANDATGKIDFGSIKFIEAGTYTYTVSEVTPTETDGITYDAKSYTIEVKVTEQVSGSTRKLVIESVTVSDKNGDKKVDLTKDQIDLGIVFTNTTPKPKLADIIVSKYLGENVPEEPEAGEKWSFDFKITFKNENDEAATDLCDPTGKVHGIPIDENGVGIFTLSLTYAAQITITGIPVGYSYDLEEIDAKGLEPTYSENHIGIIGEDTSPITVYVTNNNPAPTVASLTVLKYVKDGDSLVPDDATRFGFTLQLTDKDGKPLGEDAYKYTGKAAFVNGMLSFTLAHGESLTLTDLPDGTKYVIREIPTDGYVSDIPADGFTGTVDVATGPINISVPVTNTVVHPAGSLSVTKYVTGTGDINKEFHIKVTLSDATVNGAYGEMTFVNGVANFTICHNETVTATGLPAGITYEVTEAEANTDGYTTTYTGEIGTIPANGMAEAVITNDLSETPPPPPPTEEYGGLSVKKIVTGTGDTTKDFHITVSLGDATINGAYGGMTFENGVANFTIRHGQTVAATGLPAGITYEVTEAEANTDGYVTTYIGQTGTIPANGMAEAVITNDLSETPPPPPTEEYGGLSVKKIVTGTGDITKNFNITVTLSDTTINGQYGEMNFVDGVANFTIHHDETVTATGLPAGITYEVIEAEANTDGYTTTYTGQTGTIPANGMAEAVITNDLSETPPPPPTEEYGDLSVTKLVTGTGDTTKAFNITVTLSDATINGVYGEMNFVNGVANFTLCHGQTVTATGLPAGIAYKVTEVEANTDGYTTIYTGETGTIPANGMAEAVITNDLSETPPPPPPAEEYGSLAISKTVQSDDPADYMRSYSFTVTLSEPLTGQYGDMYFSGGTAFITLTSGQTLTASGLPAGITYSVYENDGFGFTVLVNGMPTGSASGIILSGSTQFAVFTNIKELPEPMYGSLTVTKTVTGSAGDLNKDFTFTVTLSEPLTGQYGGMYFSGGTAVFTLRHGESRTASGLPEGISYWVTETDNEGYVVESYGSTGFITANGNAVADFVNTKDQPDEPDEPDEPENPDEPEEPLGGLTVAKFVTGFGIDYQDFTFTVTLSEPLSGQYGEMTFSGGVATFTLRHGQTKSASGLPAGISYSVTESNNQYYVVTANGADGVIVGGGSASCEYINYLTEEDRPKVLQLLDDMTPLIDFNPKTGGGYVSKIGISGLLLIVSSLAVIASKRKNR